MKKVVLTRRQVMKTLIAAGLGGAYVAYTEFFLRGKKTISLSGPLKHAEDASLEVFAALSYIITLRDKLDPGITQRMYRIFMDEPWGPDHMLRLYNKIVAILPSLADKKKRAPFTDDKWQLDKGEKWFANHLLATWYTGIYYHEQRATQLVSGDDALMYDGIRGIIPIPYYEATGFGAWAGSPDNKE